MRLVDSSILIGALRRTVSPRLEARLTELISGREAAYNAAISTEILVGARTRSEFETVHRWLDSLEAFAIDGRTWESAARLGFDLRGAGVVVGLPDLLIAASAIEHGAALIHADSDFDHIAEHCGLEVESYAGDADPGI